MQLAKYQALGNAAASRTIRAAGAPREPRPRNAASLMYWKGRVDRMEIFFGADDRVTRIVD